MTGTGSQTISRADLEGRKPMTITLDLTQAPSRAVFRAEGELSFDQICDSLTSFYRVTESNPVSNVLWDLRTADVSRLSSTEMQKWANGDRGRERNRLRRDPPDHLLCPPAAGDSPSVPQSGRSRILAGDRLLKWSICAQKSR